MILSDLKIVYPVHPFYIIQHTCFIVYFIHIIFICMQTCSTGYVVGQMPNGDSFALGAVHLAHHDDRAYIPSGVPDDLVNN